MAWPGAQTGVQWSMSQLNTELGIPSTSTISLNDAAVRNRLMKQTAGAQIHLLSDSGRFVVTNGTNSNTPLVLRTDAVNAGWNQTIKLEYRITGARGSNSTSSPAVTATGSFPGGLFIRVESTGYIAGQGGQGGQGSSVIGAQGSAGIGGGPGFQAYSITSPNTLPTNRAFVTNVAFIAGGGGGGGGGGSGQDVNAGKPPSVLSYYGSGGGGGAGYAGGPGGNRGGPGGNDGGAGSTGPTAGTGGTPSASPFSGYGGPGGLYGAAGTGGQAGFSTTGAPTPGSPGGAGGAAGVSVRGTGSIQWINTGTLFGPQSA